MKATVRTLVLCTQTQHLLQSRTCLWSILRYVFCFLCQTWRIFWVRAEDTLLYFSRPLSTHLFGKQRNSTKNCLYRKDPEGQNIYFYSKYKAVNPLFLPLLLHAFLVPSTAYSFPAFFPLNHKMSRAQLQFIRLYKIQVWRRALEQKGWYESYMIR